MRSFRSALALRAALQAFAVALVLMLVGTFLLRRYLVSTVDSSLRWVAGVEARLGQGAGGPTLLFGPDGAPRRPDQPALPVEPMAQVLASDGRVLRSSPNLAGDTIPVPPDALAAARAGAVATARHTWKNEPVRSLIAPLASSGSAEPVRLLHVAASLRPVDAALQRFVRIFLLLGLASAGLAWYLGWSVAGRALEPAMALTTEAESIGVNELGRRVKLPRDLVEFRRMAEAFNGLLGRLERAVTGTRRFTSDASHELRAPLTVLRGEVELALSRPRSAEEYQVALRRCLDEVLRLTRLADDLLTLTRVEGGVAAGRTATVDLGELVQRAVSRQTALARERQVEVTVSGAGGLVDADTELLLRAIGGVLEHAIMASPPGGAVRVRLAASASPSVEVTDTGSGLRQEDISGVFQRFYRSERPRVRSSESGLGLSIARAVALSHGGTLDYVGNHPGASFRLSLPPAASAGPDLPPDPSTPRTQGPSA